MVKTTVYLEEQDVHALKRMARERSSSEASLIREAITKLTRAASRPRLKSLGIAHGPQDLAARTEELLAEGFGGEKRSDR